jgi:hypothetical protein
MYALPPNKHKPRARKPGVSKSLQKDVASNARKSEGAAGNFILIFVNLKR